MRNTLYYEWIVEQMDPETVGTDDPEIMDTSAFDSLAEAKAFAAGCDLPVVIGLTRNVGNDAEGLIDRAWAYPDADGKLPEWFDYGDGALTGAPVPARFQKELAS
jgi:hypothetical protein